jgi:hypothetical protein
MEPNNNSDDLLAKLANETETKKPGEANLGIPKSFWDEEENEEEKSDDKKDKTKPEDKNTEEESEETKGGEKKRKLTQKAKEDSARTAVGVLDLTQKIILTPIVTYKFKKKFTAAEVDRLDTGIDDANKDTLDDEDLRIRNKWDKLFKKYDKAKEAIPFTDPEKSELEGHFTTYMDIKEKELPPELLLYMSIANVLGRRIVDVIFD